MEKLIQNSNLLIPELSTLIKDVVNSCTTCIKFKKSRSRLIVGLSKTEDFNQTMSIDLHRLKPKLWYMHMVDKFARYSAADIISTKTIKAKIFTKHWNAIFGAAKSVFLGNGGKFIGESFVEMCEQFNIKIKTTPSESPYSNDLCERQNQTLTSILLKVKEDNGCNYEIVLSWALCAKIALINNNGFSPAQFVFGRNTNLTNF